jgi:hypothetical protein
MHVATAPKTVVGHGQGQNPGSGGPPRPVGSCGAPRRRAVGLRLPLRRAASGPCGSPCVFITAVPITKLFACVEGETMEDMCYERLRAEACVD